MQALLKKKTVINVHHCCPEPKITSSSYFLCPANSSKPKDSSFTQNDEEKQILTLKKLEPVSAWHVFLKINK